MSDEPIDFSQGTVRSDDAIETSNDIDFEIVDGYRAGTKLLYSKDEIQFYKRRYVKKHYVVYVCSENNCAAKVFLWPNKCVRADDWVDHNHPDMTQFRETLMFRNKMKAKAAETGPNNGIHAAYRQIVQD